MSPTHLTWHPMSSWPSRLSVIVAAALSNTMQSLSEAQKRKERPCHLHDRHDCRQANCYAQRTTEKNPHVNCPRAKKCLPPSSQRCRTHRRAHWRSELRGKIHRCSWNHLRWCNLRPTHLQWWSCSTLQRLHFFAIFL